MKILSGHVMLVKNGDVLISKETKYYETDAIVHCVFPLYSIVWIIWSSLKYPRNVSQLKIKRRSPPAPQNARTRLLLGPEATELQKSTII